MTLYLVIVHDSLVHKISVDKEQEESNISKGKTLLVCYNVHNASSIRPCTSL